MSFVELFALPAHHAPRWGRLSTVAKAVVAAITDAVTDAAGRSAIVRDRLSVCGFAGCCTDCRREMLDRLGFDHDRLTAVDMNVVETADVDKQVLVEYRYRAVREVLGGSPIGQVAVRCTSR